MSEKIKLLIITPIDRCIPPVKGGAFATRIFNIAKCNELKEKLDITIVSLYDEEAEKKSRLFTKSRFIYVRKDEKKEIRYQESKCVQFLNKIFIKFFHTILIPPPRIRKAYYEVKRDKFDYIFVGGGDPSIYGWFKKMVGRSRMIFNVGGHLLGGSVVEATFGNFICCSDYIKDYVKLDTDKCNILTILNRIDCKNFMQELSDIEHENIKKELGLGSDKTAILFMGRIVKEKGVDELLDAFTKMKDNENCVLLMAGAANLGYGGETEYEKHVKEKVKLLKENIRMLGFVHHKELWKIMKVCDYAVLPSMWEEPAGNVVPECMAAGLPIIITNSGGMVEYVNRETAIVVDKRNDVVSELKTAMEYLYENPLIRKEMRKAAQRKSKEFDFMIYYDILCEELYRLQTGNGIERRK